MQVMRVRHVRVVGGLLMISGLMRRGGFGVVVGGLRMVVRRLTMMLHSLL
jgi:hypothetical protein